ncbi:GNAT family N-acetyltransferase [Actinoplanes sp. G11-F43]|uniref:GNAT family N-acetyltransferase n=1 Tax=Actinoplanes sp. G11-F43 TaxID=3424130 RepID=UPI003D3352B1
MTYVIRAGRAADADAIVALQAAVQLQELTGGAPHPGIAAWTAGLLDGHPTVGPGDFLVAEETGTGRIAASLVELRQEWSLGGVRLPVSVVELVGTWPRDRGNRLTDRLLDVLHQRGDGTALHVIEGIPYFYRRFGYEYALANDGAPVIPVAALPAGGSGRTVRVATVDDAEALAAIDREQAAAGVWTCPRDAAAWRHEIAGRTADDLARRVVARQGDGYLVHTARPHDGVLTVLAATVRPDGATYGYLRRAGGPELTTLRLLLPPEHPLSVFGPAGVPRRARGMYVRTGDPAALIARLEPLLRARWQAAGLRWPEPTMTIDGYGRAARLHFTDGLLTGITTGRGEPGAHLRIPPGALLQLVLGHRSLAQILDTWPDCLPRDRITERFLTVAFPRVPMHVWTRV